MKSRQKKKEETVTGHKQRITRSTSKKAINVLNMLIMVVIIAWNIRGVANSLSIRRLTNHQ